MRRSRSRCSSTRRSWRSRPWVGSSPWLGWAGAGPDTTWRLGETSRLSEPSRRRGAEPERRLRRDRQCGGLLVGVVRTEIEAAGRVRLAEADELERVRRVHPGDDRDGLAMGRATGGGPGFGTAVPQAERETGSVAGKRALEVVDE